LPIFCVETGSNVSSIPNFPPMNTRVLLSIWAFSIGLALCFSCLPAATAQQEQETRPDEVVLPTADASESPTDEPTDSVLEESNESETDADQAEPRSPAKEALERALEHEKNNELDEAITDCGEAIQLDPDNIEYLTTRAELYGELRNHDKAMEDAAKILEKDPTNLRARLLRAKMLEISGDPQKSLTEFNTAVEQNPDSWQALFERQNYFERQGQHDKALADGDRMIQIKPELAAGYLSKALSHAASGEVDQAMNYANSLIQQNPENPLAYATRAAARAEQGDYETAKEDAETALKLEPDNAFIFNIRGTIYFAAGDFEKSLADFQKASELQPRHYGFKAGLADFLATCPVDHLRNGEKAYQLAKEALKLAPNDPAVWRACAAAAAETGNFAEAIQWQQRVLDSKTINPEQRTEIQDRLEAYKSNKPYHNTVNTGELALLTKLKDANDAIKNGNFDRAISLASEVIRTDDKKALAYDIRGSAYFKQNKYDLAIADFTAAIGINPKDVSAYLQRARLFQKAKQYSKARDDLLKTRDFDPTNEMQNDLAWFFATCPDDNVRDGGRAAEYVDRALELRPAEANTWDTCAAVFAENGDFDDAIEWEKAYLERKDVTEKNRHEAEQRLAMYQKHQSYREDRENEGQLTVATTPAQREK